MSNLSYFVISTAQFAQVLVFIIGCYYFFVSIIGWLKKEDDRDGLSAPQKRFALIIAAHNEEAVVGNIVESLVRQNYPRDLYDIFVIADNCEDQTAQVAEQHGALVYVRNNPSQKGKGCALEWMFGKIYSMGSKYDAISVFDADNLVASNFLCEMNHQLCKGYKVVQGYIDSKNPFDSWITCSYSIAFWLANRAFQLPRYRLGLSCSLCGTGFCIEVETLKKIGWGATCLTEDLEFTMKLAMHNTKVAWAHNAIVYDEKPITLKQSWNQRKRWMQGHAYCARHFLMPLLSKSIKHKNLISFDCCVYLFQPIRFVFIGIFTILMWMQTIFSATPIYTFKQMFPPTIWYTFVILQFLYAPVIMLFDKKFNPKVLFGLLVYPVYCLTWIPITVQGFISQNNTDWLHTIHTRKIRISDIE